MIFPAISIAQRVNDIIIDPKTNGKDFNLLLKDIESKNDVNFIYNEEDMQGISAYLIQNKTRLLNYIEDYLIEFNVVSLNDKTVVLMKKDFIPDLGKKPDNYWITQGKPGQMVTINGTIYDKSTGETVVGAQILLPATGRGAITDINGQFSIKTEAKFQELTINFIGFDKKTLLLGFDPEVAEKKLQSNLYPESQQLDVVTVTAKRLDENVRSQLTGVERMGIESIKKLPTFLGEIDPIKSMTTLPGVSTAGELSSGFNVRGGETGQNLILQDNGTIYNPSHLFGFFSAFNPDLVDNVTLYKGGGPASYGSRVASVLDISLRNGDVGRYKISGGLGLVSSRLTAEGPIKKGRSSFIIGGRISYADWLLNATKNIELTQSSAKFHDITAKIFQKINSDNFISFSVYNSHDDFKFAGDSIFSWNTLNGSFLWDHTFNDKLNSSLSIANSNYSSNLDNIDEITGFTYYNEINSLRLKYLMNFDKSEKYVFSGGIEAEGLIIEPGKLTPTKDDSNISASNMQNQKGIEAAAFVQADIDISSKLSAMVGIRLSNFFRLGGEEILKYDFNNIEQRYPVVTDTINYKNGDLINHYIGFEPRLSFRYLISEEVSLKASYFRTYQYLHLISNTTSATPQDYYVVSGPYLKPARGDQFSLGLFKNFSKNKWETSVEGFYKITDQAVDYIDGADITLNPRLEAGLVQGHAKAYGIEFLLKKKTGIFNGWIAYTFARSLRQFSQNTGSRVSINDGAYYPATYDQPHILSLVTNFELGPKTTFSANFNYKTGRPITIPINKFSYGPYLSILNYSERNEYRIPDYHRLDLSLTVKDNPSKNGRYSGEWVFSIYNVYGRKNAYSITFNKYGKAKKLSILGSTFPSITYNFNF
ncbi:TonB-dependent receptor [Marivirga atlantica]|jgi:hypothetical protein